MKIRSQIQEIGTGLYQIDLCYTGRLEYTSAYLIKDEKITLIETGTNSAVPIILDTLRELSIDQDDVQYIIVTHIHLDHSGGAGELIRHLPNARIVVHPGGAKHLIDPEKLVASARGVYGEQYEGLFGTILPVPVSKVLTFEEGMSISLGKRRLDLYYSPGHAYHHIIIHSPEDEGVFSGDAAGLLFAPFRSYGVEFLMPTTSPTQFDPQLMKQTLTLIESLRPRYIYFTHFGRSGNPRALIARAKELVDLYTNKGEEAMARDNPVRSLADELLSYHREELIGMGVPPGDPLLGIIQGDIEINAAGIMHHVSRDQSGKPGH